MFREIALYETMRQDWARTETRIQLEREALAGRPAPALVETIGRVARLLRAERESVAERTAPTPTHSVPLAS